MKRQDVFAGEVHRFNQNHDGVAAIEFALVANVFMLMLAGLAAFGVYLSASHSLQQVAAEAARAAVGGLSIEEQRDFARSMISSQGSDYPFLQAQNIESTITHPAANSITVTVRYDVDHLPVLNLMDSLSISSGTIEASSTIRTGME